MSDGSSSHPEGTGRQSRRLVAAIARHASLQRKLEKRTPRRAQQQQRDPVGDEAFLMRKRLVPMHCSVQKAPSCPGLQACRGEFLSPVDALGKPRIPSHKGAPHVCHVPLCCHSSPRSTRPPPASDTDLVPRTDVIPSWHWRGRRADEGVQGDDAAALLGPEPSTGSGASLPRVSCYCYCFFHYSRSSGRDSSNRG